MIPIMISFLACIDTNLELCSTVIFTETYSISAEETVDTFCATRAPFEAQRFLDIHIGPGADAYYIPLVSCEIVD